MRATLLPAAQDVYSTQTQRLASDHNAGAQYPYIAVLLGVVALAALVFAQRYLTRRTRRLVNPGLAAATLALLAALIYQNVAWFGLHSHLNSAQADGSSQVQALATARIDALQARADEALTLVARGSGGAFEQDFQKTMADLVGTNGGGGRLGHAASTATDPTVRAAIRRAVSDVAAWQTVHTGLRKDDDGGNYPAAVTAATGPASDAFTRVGRRSRGRHPGQRRDVHRAGRGGRPKHPHRRYRRDHIDAADARRCGDRRPAANCGVPMTTRRVRVRRPMTAAAVAILLGASMVACSSPAANAGPGNASVTAQVPEPQGVQDPAKLPAPTASGSGAPACNPYASSRRPTGALPAPGRMPAGSTMARIQARGTLRVGVDQNTYMFGYRDPATGQIVGFDIDIAHAIAKAIFGDPNKIQFVSITAAQRIPDVVNHTVDLVADTMTIKCDRLRQVAFSTIYYDAGQNVLVRKDSGLTGLADLGGQKVCAAAGSTSIANIAAIASAARCRWPSTTGPTAW